ncbi:MAG: heavy metal-binding domain-containing protein [Aquaticitalea sp.]
MILTTTNNIEGFKIIEYKGIVTGTSAELKTKFSFKTEKNMQMIEELMNEAKEQAFQRLKINATKLNANAVVGISLDIETEAGSYFFVSVTGTAVHVAV